VLLDEDHRINEHYIPKSRAYSASDGVSLGASPSCTAQQTQRDFVLDSANDSVPDLDSFFQVFSSPIAQLIASSKPPTTPSRASYSTSVNTLASPAKPEKPEKDSNRQKNKKSTTETEMESESNHGENEKESVELKSLVIPNSILFRCPACQVCHELITLLFCY
jgi:hypothetical protein